MSTNEKTKKIDRTQEKSFPKCDENSSAPKVSAGYRNFSHIVIDEKKSSACTFPRKLHQILSDPKFKSILTWQPHGRSWRLLKPEVFGREVVPLYFKHSGLSSFMRQVAGWGFRRINKGIDAGSFYHEVRYSVHADDENLPLRDIHI